jgi:hypothetical protein
MKICTFSSTFFIGILLVGCSDPDIDMPKYSYKDCQGFVEPLMHFTEALQANIKQLNYGECVDEELVKRIGSFKKQFSDCMYVELVHNREQVKSRAAFKNSIFTQADSTIVSFYHQLKTCPAQSSPKLRDLLVRTSQKYIDELQVKTTLYLYPG